MRKKRKAWPRIDNEDFILITKPVWDDHRAQLSYKDDGYAKGADLKVGCRRFYSRKDAEAHWRGGVSQESGKKRPKAKALIEWAAAEFEKRGYKW